VRRLFIAGPSIIAQTFGFVLNRVVGFPA
jgi:hypothetical protein